MEKVKHIQFTSPVTGDVVLTGSKSYTNRALILAAISKGVTTLYNYSPSQDSDLLINALRQLGVKIERTPEKLKIYGKEKNFTSMQKKIYVGAAGTTLRFLIPLCCIVGGEIKLYGTERLHQRPIAALVDAMRQLGATIKYNKNEGCPPITIKGFRDKINNRVEVNGAISSQFISALLLTAPIFPKGLKIEVRGNPISTSYIDMTCLYLKKFQLTFKNNNYKQYEVKALVPSASKLMIEGDASGASYFWGIAAATGGKISVHNISLSSIQGDIHFAKIMKKMGCDVTYEDNTITISNPNKKLQAVSVDMSLMPDTAQTLAVVASLAKGITKISGLSTLKHKETDRCQAVCNELQNAQIKCGYDNDSMYICGGDPQSQKAINTYEDHRMAMSFSILGILQQGIYIADPLVVEKSFPDFWDKLALLNGVVIRDI